VSTAADENIGANKKVGVIGTGDHNIAGPESCRELT
jgi:hypothetical protein